MKIIKTAIVLILISSGLFAYFENYEKYRDLYREMLTPFTEAVLKDVEPGVEYKLKGPRGVEYKIKNKSDIDLVLHMEVIKEVYGMQREGYEVIPDTSWIRIKDDTLTVKKGEWAQTEIFLKVPEDEDHYGKSYQAYISAQHRETMIWPGISSYVLFTVKEKKSFLRRIFWFLP